MGNRSSRLPPDALEEQPQQLQPQPQPQPQPLAPPLPHPQQQHPPPPDNGIRVVCPTCRHTLIPPHLETRFLCPCGQELRLTPPPPPAPLRLPYGARALPAAHFLAPQNLPPPGHPQYNAALYAHSILSRLPVGPGGVVDMRSFQQLVAQLERDRKGMPQSALELFPTRAWADLPEGSTVSEEARSCGICMEPYKAGEEVRTLPCLHLFHTACCA